MENDCINCFHFGISCRSGKEECAIKDKLRVCPGNCTEFVEVEND